LIKVKKVTNNNKNHEHNDIPKFDSTKVKNGTHSGTQNYEQ